VPAALAGFLALAAAMGIGRFAFTPVLPLMQQQFGLSLAAGGVLAAANYAGYLVGALAAMRAARQAAPGRTRLVAAMTTAFAVGQLVGPLLVRGDDLATPSVLAAAVLLAAALLLRRTKGHRGDDAGDRTDAVASARDDEPRRRGSRRPDQRS
jgi:MFS family permease